MKYQFSKYNISNEHGQEILEIAKDVCLKYGVGIASISHYEIDVEDVPTLVLTLHLNMNDCEKIAELQWKLNGAIVDYEIENKLEPCDISIDLCGY